MKITRKITSIILAAGKGTRMGSPERQKVCFSIDGTPAIIRLLRTFSGCGIHSHIVVVGHGAEKVMKMVRAQVDNALYTGFGPRDAGLDLGAGDTHPLRPYTTGGEPDISPSEPGDLKAPEFDGTFARFIWDRRVTARTEPYNKDSYLLISAGPDALWGTQDDITNFDM